ncbi:MAG: pantetheine-phosphate adenylyltransferase, partial [Firmicutes bacterium]|nr:pantetheine-phosphate adenylyltransferase [Bacillota bacterium]
ALRAACLFEKIIVGIAKENYKNTMFSLEERCRLAEAALKDQPNIVVMPFDGLLVDFCKEQGATSIIRGLRAVSDFDMEFQMALMNRKISGGVDTVFLMSDAKYQFISSSLIRNAAELGADIADMVPGCVALALREKARK